jgi:hypothetical protein
MLPIPKGTGAQLIPDLWMPEIHQELNSFRHLLDKIAGNKPGGVWKPCISDGHVGYAYDLQGSELFVIRLELEQTPVLRFMTDHRDEIGLIVESPDGR